MAIVPLKKVVLLGAASREEEAVRGLQELGCLHLVGFGESELEPEQRDVNARAALDYLERAPDEVRPTRRREGFAVPELVPRTLAIRDRLRDLHDEREGLRVAIERLEPWGDFRRPEAGELRGLRLHFREIPIFRMDELREVDEPWQEVNRRGRTAYVVMLATDERATEERATDEPEGLPGTGVELDPRPLGELRRELAAVEREIDDLHHERIGLTRWRVLLAEHVAEADEAAARRSALRTKLDAGPVCGFEAWIPVDRLVELEEFAAERGLALRTWEPGPLDDPPTLLRNPEPLAGGEGTVTFYMTPGYRSWDPSVVVFFAFALFFAMILGDAGYGMLLAGVLGWQWPRLSRTQGGRRFRNLGVALVSASIVYGILAGSYFGWSPPPGSPLAAVRVLDVNDYDLMMGVSITLGVLHLVLANVVTARRERSLAPLGWVVALLAGWSLYLAQNLRSAEIASAIDRTAPTAIAVGLAVVFLFTSRRPLLPFSVKNLVGRFVDGLLGLTRITNAFGDVLSYLRLFALGLASAQLAATFNRLALGGDHEGHGGPGLLLALLILVVGHTLNLTLAVMSGVVHGLRLNCIEFFNWSLTEEGHPFRPFARRTNPT